MVRSVEAVFRDGRVEFLEPAPPNAEGRVIVTFITDGNCVDLAGRGISAEQAGELRARLAAFAQDWDSPEMKGYDAL